MKKRLLAWILSFALALSLLPVGVLAAEPHPFQDVPSDHWANEAVQYVYEEGLMDGVGPTTFAPGGTLTRAMFVTILGRQDGVAEDSQGENPFTDVADGQWYTPYVTWAAQEDIVGGYGDNRFGPTDPITREQMAAILYRYAQYKGYDTSETGSLDTFPDAGEVSEYAVAPMEWTVGTGLIAGMEDNTLRPQGTATRAQAATLLMRFCETVVGEPQPEPTTYTVTFDWNYDNKGTYTTANVEEGQTVQAPANPTRSGYTFAGWYTQATGGEQFDFGSAVTGDVTVYAYWEEETNIGEITLEDGQNMVDLVDTISEMDKVGTTQAEVKDYLESIDWISNIAETPDGGITCRTTFGVSAVWTPYQPEMISSDGGGTTFSSSSDFGSLRTTVLRNSVNNQDVDSIIILCPYASTDNNFNIDGYTYLAKTVEKYAGCSVTILKDEEVSLSALKNLDNYDMVWFYSHGALSNASNSPWAIRDSDPYTMTGEIVSSPTAYVGLSTDFAFGRTILDLSTGRIGVGGRFYEHYYEKDQLDGTFFHFASCNSMKTEKLADGILSRGASWVEGWTNSVTFDNDYVHFMYVVEGLLSGKSIQESINDALDNVKSNYNSVWQYNCQLVGKGDTSYRISTNSLSGKVISTSGVPLENVTITSQGITDSKLGFSTITDKNGEFSLRITSQKYKITFEKSGYTTQVGTLDCTSLAGKEPWTESMGTITLTPAPKPENQAVTGTVLDFSTLQPLAGVTVALNCVYGSGGEDLAGRVTTAEDGTFSIPVPENITGFTTLKFSKAGFEDYTLQIDQHSANESFSVGMVWIKPVTSANIIEGTCGDNVTWKLTLDDGTLNINGTGPMEEYGNGYNESLLTTPWKDYVEEITTINIANGVTTIGSSAFSLCTSLEHVSIPSSVTSIGQYAFYHCYNMRSIEIPEGVTGINYCAFANCSNLGTIQLPSSLQRIGMYAFENCFSLYMVSLPDGITIIPQGLFSKCSQLTYISIPTSVRTVEDDAFYGCSSLAEVYYGGSELDWNNIEISDHQDFTGSQSGNANLTAAVIHYNTSF